MYKYRDVMSHRSAAATTDRACVPRRDQIRMKKPGKKRSRFPGQNPLPIRNTGTGWVGGGTGYGTDKPSFPPMFTGLVRLVRIKSGGGRGSRFGIRLTPAGLPRLGERDRGRGRAVKQGGRLAFFLSRERDREGHTQQFKNRPELIRTVPNSKNLFSTSKIPVNPVNKR
jgi:hypothetical protein